MFFISTFIDNSSYLIHLFFIYLHDLSLNIFLKAQFKRYFYREEVAKPVEEI